MVCVVYNVCKLHSVYLLNYCLVYVLCIVYECSYVNYVQLIYYKYNIILLLICELTLYLF